MKALVTSALATLVSTGFVFCQTSDQPIPAKWLRDGRIVVSEFNFSIDSPNTDTHWSYRELQRIQGFKTTAFTAHVADKESYTLIVWEAGSNQRLDDAAGRKSFVDGMQKSLPKGWQASTDPAIESSSVPMSGSWRVKTTAVRADDGAVLYGFLYTVGGRRSYMFITYSQDPTEPPQFSRFVSSFALLSPSDNALPARTSASNSGTGIIFLVSIVGAVIDWRYKRRGGKKPTKKDRIYFLGAVVISIVFVAFLGVLGVSAGGLGDISGLLIVLLFAFWEVGRLMVRRKYPVTIAPVTIAPPPLT